ncbi:hypothetical protein BC938DRAFT_477362 [Jimgerdemannia flammicorona]|uniref:Uncharacterized protein n=1 Tax=Jimgerdemannia flammicorona TaxID=994334 RepID=A0A433PA94_9FUNG|nr:hypothetical protein BC938DRAFT_477362 [Jimgerdemannia flammicorona]
MHLLSSHLETLFKQNESQRAVLAELFGLAGLRGASGSGAGAGKILDFYPPVPPSPAFSQSSQSTTIPNGAAAGAGAGPHRYVYDGERRISEDGGYREEKEGGKKEKEIIDIHNPSFDSPREGGKKDQQPPKNRGHIHASVTLTLSFAAHLLHTQKDAPSTRGYFVKYGKRLRMIVRFVTVLRVVCACKHRKPGNVPSFFHTINNQVQSVLRENELLKRENEAFRRELDRLRRAYTVPTTVVTTPSPNISSATLPNVGSAPTSTESNAQSTNSTSSISQLK